MKDQRSSKSKLGSIFTVITLFCLSMPFADTASKWKWGGAAYGVELWFKVGNECKNGAAWIQTKLINRNAWNMNVQYRIKSSEFSQKVEANIPAAMTDSGFVMHTEEGVCYPTILELEGQAMYPDVVLSSVVKP